MSSYFKYEDEILLRNVMIKFIYLDKQYTG